MKTIKFDSTINNRDITFVVILCSFKGQWLFCKHKDRQTYESPGGNREEGEGILQTAHRELFEESGATEYDLKLVSPYIMKSQDEKGIVDYKYGMLFYADIKEISTLPESEIELIRFFENIPRNLTYPDVQYDLMNKAIIELNLKIKIGK